jgi:hypothetical protein
LPFGGSFVVEFPGDCCRLLFETLGDGDFSGSTIEYFGGPVVLVAVLADACGRIAARGGIDAADLAVTVTPRTDDPAGLGGGGKDGAVDTVLVFRCAAGRGFGKRLRAGDTLAAEGREFGPLL